jgi:hypothetical protein
MAEDTFVASKLSTEQEKELQELSIIYLKCGNYTLDVTAADVGEKNIFSLFLHHPFSANLIPLLLLNFLTDIPWGV